MATATFRFSSHVHHLISIIKVCVFFLLKKNRYSNDSSIRFLAILKYFSFISIPINFRFVFIQATPVEPLPMKQSSTMSFSLEEVLIKYSNKSTPMNNRKSFEYAKYFDLICSEPNKDNYRRTNRYALGRFAITTGFGLEMYKGRIDRAIQNKQLLILYYHSVTMQNESFLQLLKDIISYAKSSGIEITTLSSFFQNS